MSFYLFLFKRLWLNSGIEYSESIKKFQVGQPSTKSYEAVTYELHKTQL